MIERSGERSDFVLLVQLDAVIVISGSDFTSSAGQFQHRTRDAACDPQAEDTRQRQAKEGKAEVSAFKPKIGREFLIERALQERDRVSILGWKRRDVTRKNFAGEWQLNELLRRERAIAQHLGNGQPIWQGCPKQLRAIEERDLEVSVALNLARKIVVDAEHRTKPGDGIGRE